MNVAGKHYRTIWLHPEDTGVVQLIDQRFLPHQFAVEDVATVEQIATTITEMHVRGAGLIGAAAGFGMYLAAHAAATSATFDEEVDLLAARLKATRPTAVNLAWAVDRQLACMRIAASNEEKIAKALETAQAIADEDAEHCRSIGRHGLELIQKIARKTGRDCVNVLTHCNAGWLAFVDYGLGDVAYLRRPR